MKIVVAPDSYKGSLTAINAAKVMKKAIKTIEPTYDVVLKPMADGGEGTLDILLREKDGEKISVSCTGPLGEKVTAVYGLTKCGTAIIETASIAGLTLVPTNLRNPANTT